LAQRHVLVKKCKELGDRRSVHSIVFLFNPDVSTVKLGAHKPDARPGCTAPTSFLVKRPVRTGHLDARAGRKKLVVQCFFSVRAVRPASANCEQVLGNFDAKSSITRLEYDIDPRILHQTGGY